MVEDSLPARWLAHFLRCFFRLLYHQLSWAYDTVAYTVSLGRWKRWIMTTLPYLEGPAILELGCGPGHLQQALFARGMVPVGLDASLYMANRARKRINRMGVLPLINNAYAQYLPFLDESFDQIVATFPSEYIFEQNTLAEVKRVLKPGGILIVLPVAWILGQSLGDRLAALTFKITRQAPKDSSFLDEQITRPFVTAGFQTTLIRQPVNQSQVLLVLARKPPIVSRLPSRLWFSVVK